MKLINTEREREREREREPWRSEKKKKKRKREILGLGGICRNTTPYSPPQFASLLVSTAFLFLFWDFYFIFYLFF